MSMNPDSDNNWRSPRNQFQGTPPPWQSPQNRGYRGGRGGDRFYSPRNSPRTPQHFSPYNNYNRSSPPSFYNSPQSPYQPRYSPQYHGRPRQNFYQSSPRGYHNQSSFSSPKSFGRSPRPPRGSGNWSKDDIENWIHPTMWEDPWKHLRKKTADDQELKPAAPTTDATDEIPSKDEEVTSRDSPALEDEQATPRDSQSLGDEQVPPCDTSSPVDVPMLQNDSTSPTDENPVPTTESANIVQRNVNVDAEDSPPT